MYYNSDFGIYDDDEEIVTLDYRWEIELMGGLGNIEYCCAFSSTQLIFAAMIQKFHMKLNFFTAESSSRAFSTGTQPGSSTSTGDRSAPFNT